MEAVNRCNIMNGFFNFEDCQFLRPSKTKCQRNEGGKNSRITSCMKEEFPVCSLRNIQAFKEDFSASEIFGFLEKWTKEYFWIFWTLRKTEEAPKCANEKGPNKNLCFLLDDAAFGWNIKQSTIQLRQQVISIFLF